MEFVFPKKLCYFSDTIDYLRRVVYNICRVNVAILHSDRANPGHP